MSKLRAALSLVALTQRDYDLARSTAEEHVTLGTAIGERVQGSGHGRYRLALATMAAGDYAAAIATAEEHVRDLEGLATSLEALFGLASRGVARKRR